MAFSTSLLILLGEWSPRCERSRGCRGLASVPLWSVPSKLFAWASVVVGHRLWSSFGVSGWPCGRSGSGDVRRWLGAKTACLRKGRGRAGHPELDSCGVERLGQSRGNVKGLNHKGHNGTQRKSNTGILRWESCARAGLRCLRMTGKCCGRESQRPRAGAPALHELVELCSTGQPWAAVPTWSSSVK